MKKENVIYSILIVSIISVIIIYKYKLNTTNESIDKYGETTVGYIIKRSFTGRISTSGYSYTYIYYVDNIKCENGIIEERKFDTNQYFEVEYLSENPQNSRLNFSRPGSSENVSNYYNDKNPFK